MQERSSMQRLLFSTADQLMDKNTNQNAIFANNELSLRHIQVYGFDFDFTLIEYSEEVLKFIYERTRDRLVNALNVCSPVIT